MVKKAMYVVSAPLALLHLYTQNPLPLLTRLLQ